MGLPQSGFKTPKGRVGLRGQAESLSGLALPDFQACFQPGLSLAPAHLYDAYSPLSEARAATPRATRTLPVNAERETAKHFQ